MLQKIGTLPHVSAFAIDRNFADQGGELNEAHSVDRFWGLCFCTRTHSIRIGYAERNAKFSDPVRQRPNAD